jgi:hypothetical protein
MPMTAWLIIGVAIILALTALYWCTSFIVRM